MHAEVPRVACKSCGKTTQVSVPWAREGSGLRAAVRGSGLGVVPRRLAGAPVRADAARALTKQLWRRIEHYVTEARRQQDMSGVSLVGIDETQLRKG